MIKQFKIIKMKQIGIIGIFMVVLLSVVQAQRSPRSADVYVDQNGIIRWSKSRTEVQGFGVNYTAPFAHAYTTAKNLSVDIEKAIADDVYHFSRLGFDLYRVHVWDCQISDTLGNLLVNEHTKLFDYMIMKMKERGMKFVLTPIAYWGNGWPAPDEKTPGFSSKYGKDACLVNEEAIKAQGNYLAQFLNHVNEYTGIAYKNDPDLIGFEISNEPHHREEAGKVTAFINRMVTSMRSTGCQKPIFYNITHSIHLADAYFNADIQGGTFQWYPTGLGSRHELGGNQLPNVDRYVIPFDNHPKFKPMAKIVYEFDAADVGRSYIYPAMARSFREAGMQIATHFAYDPTYMANVNTEYGTHYMNLAYAPQKALSLAIAGEVFHTIPAGKSYGRYPNNTTFGSFMVNYESDLALMNTPEKFIYTNTTTAKPVSADKLTRLAGAGNSPVIQYAGTGAYFLDRLESGVWRLEVMPDAVWVHDPFERTSPKKEIAVINHRKWPMTVNLFDLGEGFTITPLNEGNKHTPAVNGKSFDVVPGSYLISKKGIRTKYTAESKWNNIVLKEFAAPATSLKKTYVLHKPSSEISAGKAHIIEAVIASPQSPESVELYVEGAGGRSEFLKMENTQGYSYIVTIPERLVNEGFLKYHIVVKQNNAFYTYPSGVEARPWHWDFYDENPYEVRVVPSASPVWLFNAATDSDKLLRPWIRNSVLKPLAEPGKAELLINVEKLFTQDPENMNGTKIYDYSAKYFFGTKIEGRVRDVASKQKLVVRARSLNNKPCVVQVSLVLKDGSAYGGLIALNPEAAEHTLLLSGLKRVNPAILPRPFPTFLPYYFEGTSVTDFDIQQAETIQVSIGPGIAESQLHDKHGIAIESVWLE